MAVSLAALAAATSSGAVEETPATGDPVEVLETPAFPEKPPSKPLRVWLGSYLAPSADFGRPEVTLVRPDVSFRLRLPVDHRFSAELTGDFSASIYDTDGRGPVFTTCPECSLPDEAYSASFGVQSGYVLKLGRHLFRSDERWALLGDLSLSADWEAGAFEESISPGASLGCGYELPSTLRIALGARVERALDGDGVDLGPSVYLRWDVTREFRIRNRGLGVRVEYLPTGRFELFATGYQARDRFRLDDRPGLSAGATFRDRQALVGGGMVVKLSRTFRMTVEMGAIVDRNLAVDTRDDGKLEGVDGDVSPYFTLRLEIRP
jgi:hypothetical protein